MTGAGHPAFNHPLLLGRRPSPGYRFTRQVNDRLYTVEGLRGGQSGVRAGPGPAQRPLKGMAATLSASERFDRSLDE